MSLSPAKHRTLSRQPSSPSLAVGLPPPLPESNIMAPSTPSKMPRTKSKKRIHRGDVSSTASSDAEDAPMPIPGPSQSTPKRKVVNPIEPVVPVGSAKKKRQTLAERLAAAAEASAGKAKVKASSSVKEGLKESNSMSTITGVPSSSSAGTVSTPLQARTSLVPSSGPSQRIIAPTPGGGGSAADKVVVCVRIKPTQSPFASMAYDITSTSLSLSDNHPKVKQRGGKAGREDGYTYTFDKLLQYPSTTPELYADKVAPLVEKAMNGFNSTVFAYGQTGSGKSHTMTGIPQELGIIPCAVDGVFDAITADPERAFLLRVSYVEIYNETLRDLLNFKKGPLRDDERPAIHTAKGKVYVDPLVEEIVSTPEDVMELLEKGNTGRRIGATDWNERSSRSHCVFTIVVESRPRDGEGDEDIRLSRLNLIDLAGSEKAVSDSERRGEGKHINQSLLALREVINKLTEKNKASHIPYRNSKLTHLLENALGGDSNICVICTMSAEEEHCPETLETLKFAGRCSQVKTNAKKNVIASSERALIKAKDQEIEELRARLVGLQNGQPPSRAGSNNGQISDLAESVAAMEARKAKLTAQLAKLNGEILTSELPRPGTATPLSPPKPKRRRISDFSAIMSTGSDRIGLGVGTPKKVNDRRAISGLVRVAEGEEEMPGIMGTLEAVTEGGHEKNFDNDRVLAGLRRSLAHKEEELSLANRNLATALSRASQLSERDERIATLTSELSAALESLASLQSTLQHTESGLKDRSAQLETMRADLVATIEDKASKIDELESKVLDLRKSREELAIEDEGRLQEVRKELVKLQSEKEGVSERLAGLEKEVQEARGKAEEAEKKRKEEADKATAQLAALAQQHAEGQSSANSAAAAKIVEYESSVAALQAQLNELLAARTARDAEFAALQASVADAQRQRDQTAADLDRFQQEALANESKVLDELREEIGNLRKLREDDKAVWERRRDELEAGQVAAKEGEEKLKGQIQEALKTLGDAARANAALEEKLARHAEGKKAVEKERNEARQRLADEAGGAKAQLEGEMAARKEMEAKLQEVSRLLDEQRAAADAQAKVLEQERQAGAALQARLDAAQRDMEVQEKRIEKEVGGRKDVEKRAGEMEKALDKAEREWKKKVEGVEGKLVAMEKEREMGASFESELRGKLDAELAARQVAEGKLAELVTIREASAAAEAQLAKMTKLRDASAAKERELQQRLDAETATRLEAETKLADLAQLREAATSAEGELQARLATEVASREATEKKLADIEQQREAEATATTAAAADLRKKLDLEVTGRRVAEKKLVELARQRESASAAESDLQKRLEAEVASREALGKKVLEGEKARAEEVAGLRKQLEEEAGARERAERGVAGMEERVQEVAGLRKQLAGAAAAQEELKKKVATLEKASAMEVEGLRKQLAESDSAREEFEKKAAALEKANVEEVEGLRKQLDGAVAAKSEAEKKHAMLAVSVSADGEKQKLLDAEATKRQTLEKRISALDSQLASLQDQLQRESSERQGAERKLAQTSQDLVAKHERALKALDEELVSLRQSLKAAQAQANDAQADASAQRDKATKLASDLVALEARSKEEITIATSTSVSSRLRTISTPGPWAKDGQSSEMGDATVKGLRTQTLRGASGMGGMEKDSSMGRLRARDGEEIDRLEKVVEMQKGIIDEQREKIERWSKEMEKQREIVRLLTNDNSANPFSPSPRPAARGHGKAHSISHSPTNSPGAVATPPGKGFPSTFTARNLALPTTPTPFPVHPSQFSNATARGRRRVTIEHDMDRLTESSKVNKAKAVFESPEKGHPAPATPTREPLRATQAAWSIPRQRKP
ncbi:hypothetical protein IAT38_003841 [Cryptococcus sp. DSM 104549]